MEHFPVLAVMSLFLCAFLVEIFGSKNKVIRNAISLLATGFAFVLMVLLIKPVMVDGEIITYWMGNWEPVNGYAIGIGYEVDALGLLFALIISLGAFLSCIYSIRYMEHDHHLGHYYTLFLMLVASMLGLVQTGDLFNMFVMIEVLTFAAVALTAFRNNAKGSLEAAFKYLVTGCIGSTLILMGVVMIYGQCHTLNMAQVAAALSGNMNPNALLALAFLIAGFGVKTFMVPFHAPLADVHMAAPSSVSMILSGVVIKVGVYGIIRMAYVVFQVMDVAAVQMMLVILGTLTMFVGATMAIAQRDFKRLLAFSSISQIGYVVTAAGLGTALGLTGAFFHAFNHMLFKGLLFLCAGAVQHATGTLDLDKLGGLSKKMPKTTLCFLFGVFAISGIPPFNGFSSKWMIYQATYAKALETGNFLYAIVTIVAVVVSVMTLAYFIKLTQAVFFGQTTECCKKAKEIPFSMQLPLWIMSALCLLGGVFYNVVEKYLLQPAVNAAANVTRYVDVMMGEGYAASAGVVNTLSETVNFSMWNPMVWLVLFVVVFLAVGIVIITNKNSRGAMLSDENDSGDAKFATFFSGEESLPSHVGGSDMFWGFRYNMKGYFKFMRNAHSGIVTDYSLWSVVGTAVIILVVFVFMG